MKGMIKVQGSHHLMDGAGYKESPAVKDPLLGDSPVAFKEILQICLHVKMFSYCYNSVFLLGLFLTPVLFS